MNSRRGLPFLDLRGFEESVEQIAARGFDRATFGRDWRYPITSGYKSSR